MDIFQRRGNPRCAISSWHGLPGQQRHRRRSGYVPILHWSVRSADISELPDWNQPPSISSNAPCLPPQLQNGLHAVPRRGRRVPHIGSIRSPSRGKMGLLSPADPFHFSITQADHTSVSRLLISLQATPSCLLLVKVNWFFFLSSTGRIFTKLHIYRCGPRPPDSLILNQHLFLCGGRGIQDTRTAAYMAKHALGAILRAEAGERLTGFSIPGMAFTW